METKTINRAIKAFGSLKENAEKKADKILSDFEGNIEIRRETTATDEILLNGKKVNPKQIGITYTSEEADEICEKEAGLNTAVLAESVGNELDEANTRKEKIASVKQVEAVNRIRKSVVKAVL